MLSPTSASNKGSESFMDSLKATLRPYLERVIGHELSNSILGQGATDIVLPKIPKVLKDAKSTAIYSKKESLSTKYNKEELDQYNYNFIVELFVVTKGLGPGESDISKWMNVMNQGGSHEGIYRAMVLDNAYYSLESQENPINKAIVDFSVFYLDRFIGTRVKRETLEKSNFYTLKRATLEKTLDVVDSLSKDRNTLLNWYAILSSDLALKYPLAWAKKVRQIKQKKSHKAWANSVSIQIIKAEVIIKLHKIFNYLNLKS